VGIGETRFAGGQQDISHQRQLETTGSCDAVNAHDNRAIKSGHSRWNVMLCVYIEGTQPIRVLAHGLQIQARTKSTACANQYDGPNTVITL
jgi:hypothetical protein